MDLDLDGGISLLNVSEDTRISLNSSDVVKDLFLQETAATEATLKATTEQSLAASIRSLSSEIKLTADLERLSSSEWVQYYVNGPAEPADPSMFTNGDTERRSYDSAPPLSMFTNGETERRSYDSAPPLPPLPELFKGNTTRNDTLSEQSSTSAFTSTTSTSSTTEIKHTPKKKKKKRRKQRVLDERVVEPTDGDVLYGKGPTIHSHPGNVRFRQEALRLYEWYEISSKEEKEKIADVLVESVKSEGHRFLEKGEDKLWHEVIYGEHTKASQAFRDLFKRSGR